MKLSNEKMGTHKNLRIFLNHFLNSYSTLSSRALGRSVTGFSTPLVNLFLVPLINKYKKVLKVGEY